MFAETYAHLRSKKKILFLTTSNRWSGEAGGEKPKSTRIAEKLQSMLGKEKVQIIDVSKLKLYPCEGNISTASGNSCGLREAQLQDPEKNPTGEHRCWASLNHGDDELWKVSKLLLQSDAVVFFGSVRWGQMNSIYQLLIERLTWIENRHTTLQESNMVSHIDAGIIVFGQNWRGKEVLEVQKQVLSYFGFRLREELCWSWSYSEVSTDESPESYQAAARQFEEEFME